MSRAIDLESIDPGTMLEMLSIPALTRITLARFAGAVDDYNPMHLDDKVAVAAGKESVFAPNTLVMAYVGRMVQSWLAGLPIRVFGLRMLRLVWPGDVLTCRGVVVDKREEEKEYLVSVDVWADNQRGETVAKGRAMAAVAKAKRRTKTSATEEVGVTYAPWDAPVRKPSKRSKAPTVKQRAS